MVGKDGKYLGHVSPHPSEFVDVVSINITNQLVRSGFKPALIPYDLLSEKKDFRNQKIFIGSEIFVLGYPDGIYESSNSTPILREGIISTAPDVNYNFNKRMQTKYNLPPELNGFLIDAKVFPGSSGSLIVLKSEYLAEKSPSDEPLWVRRPNLVLGILSGSIPIYDSVIKVYQRMGLGVVYSSETIKEVIDIYY